MLRNLLNWLMAMQKQTARPALPQKRGFTMDEPIFVAGRWFPVAFDATNPPKQEALSDSDILDAARRHNVPAAHLDAVRKIESRKSGFLLNEPAPARPKILFEGHWFYRLTPKPVSRVRPDLSHRSWTNEHYQGGSAEWGRLEDAVAFDPDAAYQATSWGMGQVMGFNFQAAGCKSIEDFILEAFHGEAKQFGHMLNFIENKGLMDDLRRGDWRAFARGYNGPQYYVHDYDGRLDRAAKRSKFA